MQISTQAIRNALEGDLMPSETRTDRFRPLLDLAADLFQCDRAFLILMTPGNVLEFHSSRFIDAQTESGLERLCSALLREWSKHPFLVFTPDSVTPDFAGGLLKRRPFRQQPFLCLLLSAPGRVLGIFFLEGKQIGEPMKEADSRRLDIFHRLCSYVIEVDNQFQDLARGCRKLLDQLSHSQLEELEREGILRCLKRNYGNVARTHMELGIPRMSFYQKLRRYRIKPQQFRNRPESANIPEIAR
jgi:hypothetical protein